MKTKNNLAITVMTSIICLLPIICSFALYDKLPDKIAIHWDIQGNPDNFLPKAIAAFGLPILFLIINLFSKMRLYNDPKRSNTSQTMQIFVTWLPPVLSLIVIPITLFIAIGVNIPISLIVSILLGIVFIICGNYLPKSRQNYTIGIKLPWTLHDADNWNKTHRLAGYLWILGGIIIVIMAFLSENIDSTKGVLLNIYVVIFIMVIPVLYSYLFYKKQKH